MVFEVKNGRLKMTNLLLAILCMVLAAGFYTVSVNLVGIYNALIILTKILSGKGDK